MRKYGISYDENGSNEDHEEYQPLSPESQGREQKSSNGLPLVKTYFFPKIHLIHKCIRHVFIPWQKETELILNLSS